MSSILSIAYGPSERITDTNDPFLDYHEQYVHEFENMMGLRGVHFTALIPWLNNIIPDSKWVPKSVIGWREMARRIKTKQAEIFETFLGKVEERMKRLERGELVETGEEPCHMQNVLERKEEFGFKTRDLMAYVIIFFVAPYFTLYLHSYHGGVLIDGGTDTLAMFTRVFVLMLILHPHVSTRLVAELQTVMGEDFNKRLPNYEDAKKMKYFECVVREVTRIWPPSPIVPPHLVNDEGGVGYNGWEVEGGSVIVMNLWGMQRDPGRLRI
jgi:hypothetical protein